jgi:hypothetical protein
MRVGRFDCRVGVYPPDALSRAGSLLASREAPKGPKEKEKSLDGRVAASSTWKGLGAALATGASENSQTLPPRESGHRPN